MGGTHFLQTGYLLLNRNAPLLQLTIFQFQKLEVYHFFILGAISSTTVTRKYTPYSNQVIVLLQGKLFSG